MQRFSKFSIGQRIVRDSGPRDCIELVESMHPMQSMGPIDSSWIPSSPGKLQRIAVSWTCGNEQKWLATVLEILIVNMIKRIVGKLRRIILLQFEFITLRFVMGETENLTLHDFWIFGTCRKPY